MNIRYELENEKEDKLSNELHNRIYQMALKIDKELGIGVYICGENKRLKRIVIIRNGQTEELNNRTYNSNDKKEIHK